MTIETLILQAHDRASMAHLLIDHGLLVSVEGGLQHAPGVTVSDIGQATVGTGEARVDLDGHYCMVGLDDTIANRDSLVVALQPHRYTGTEPIRLVLGGQDYDAAHPVPYVVTMRQARLALLAAGKLSGISAAIDAIPDAAQREAARITWEYSTEVQRHNGLVAQLGPALGLTEEQVDALFVAAKGL